MSVRAALIFAAALTLSAAPAAAQEAVSTYDEGVAARLSGDPGRAVQLLEPLVAQDPENVDARVQLGYAYLAVDRLDDAREQFQNVLTRAPDYADAQEGLDLVLKRRAASPGNHSWLLVEGAISDLTRGRRDWHEIGAVGSFAIADRDTLGLRASHYERFDLADTELSALYTHRAGRDVWLRVGGSVTPSADFRPSIGVTAGVDYRLGAGGDATVLGFDAAWRSFPLQDVWIVSPVVTQYVADGKASITVRGDGTVAQGDRLRVGGLVRGDFYPNYRARIFIGAAGGPDTDFGVVTDRKSLFGGFELPVSDGISLVASAAHDWRDGRADRMEGRLGLKVGL